MNRTWPLALVALLASASFGYLAGAAPNQATAGNEEAQYSPVPPVEPPIENANMRGRARSGAIRNMIRSKPDVRDFTVLWGTNPDGMFANTFMGIPTIQNPTDVWITHEILYEVKPDFIVEAGTLQGGSAALWSTFLEQIHPSAKIITIDIRDQVTAAKELPIVKKRVEFLIGSSVDPEIVEQVRKRVAGGRVLVILDSSHTEEHVYNELQAYHDMVSLGSYLIVQDTGMGIPRYERWPNAPPGGQAGADLAVRRFMKDNPQFQTDLWRERLVMTNNPGGFLRRVR
jgi:cephalosporin hydroxylase